MNKFNLYLEQTILTNNKIMLINRILIISIHLTKILYHKFIMIFNKGNYSKIMNINNYKNRNFNYGLKNK